MAAFATSAPPISKLAALSRPRALYSRIDLAAGADRETQPDASHRLRIEARWGSGRDRNAARRIAPACDSRRERAAMRALAGTFREETEDALGRRWYAHFERWLCARRDATRDGDAIPSAKRRDARDGGLARSLAKAGRTTGEMATTTRRLARAAAKARANASARASDGRKNRVRARRIEVGGNGKRAEKVALTCGKVTLELNLRHYETLKTRWRGDARRDEDGFHRAVFCVVARYATLQGTHYKAGNMQAAIPPRVFETLEKDSTCDASSSRRRSTRTLKSFAARAR